MIATGCPDWAVLLAARDAAPKSDPPGWDDARRHLRGCAACRGEALALDPTLVFCRLPEPEVDAAEIDRMRLAVATLRRAEPLRATPRLRSAGPRRLALAAGLLVACLTQLPGGFAPPEVPATVAGRTLASPAALRLSPVAEGVVPVVEDLDRPQARVYEMGSEELAVVMIVDESLDI